MSSEQSTSKALPTEKSFLEEIASKSQLVNIYLVSGIRLQGYVASFDTYTVLLKSNTMNANHQLIYKHAISTILVL